MFISEESTTRISRGTGFTVRLNTGEKFLITNWHNVTGKDAETDRPLSSTGYTDPLYIKAHFLARDRIDQWIVKKIYLRDEHYSKFYIEHPRGREVDVVAIKLPDYEDVDIHNAFDALIGDQFVKQVSDSCSIIGYPQGISTAGKFPIWKTGNIASEIEIDHDDRPMFLIDASTREGMSGSPVYCISRGITNFPNGTKTFVDEVVNFLGIYSGRIGNDIEIGRVFKQSCLNDIFFTYYSK